MICMGKSKILLLIINTLLSLAVFALFYSPSICLGAEKTYQITESQLTQLEMNLTELKKQNKTLQTQLQISQTQVQILQKQSKTLQAQSTQLQEKVISLTQSLMNANQLLNKYESNQQKNSYTIGVGGGSNGLGVYASKDKTWLYLDRDIATIGWQIEF